MKNKPLHLYLIFKNIELRHIMKLTVFLPLLLSAHLCAAAGYSQTTKVKIKSKEAASLGSLIQAIEDQTEYLFIYNEKEVDTNQKVSVSSQEMSVKDVLNESLDRINLTYELSGNYISLKKEKEKENRTSQTEVQIAQQSKSPIKGKILDVQGEPLIGVTVLVKGTTVGTITDPDGNFSIEASAGKVLDISYVGYKPISITVEASKTNYDITMEENSEVLEEVIVVGYGIQKKDDITGAMVNVNSKTIHSTPVASVSAALQGLAAGVDIQMAGGSTHPGATPQIRIRGERSINGTNEALIVLDGIPFSGNLNDISNDDIESLSVLKDASATAIYGSRGANGVILITTKKGAEGRTKVSYSGYYGIVKAIKKFDMMTSSEYIRLKQWAYYNANSNKYSGPDDPEIMQLNRVFKDQTEMDGYYAGNDTDWQDLIYEDGMTTNHQLALSGGSEKTTYNASLGYYKGENTYAAHSFERMTAKISVDSKLNDHIKFGLSSMNSYIINKGENNNPMDQAFRASPFATPYDKDGNLTKEIPGSGGQVWNPVLDIQKDAIVDRRRALSTFNVGYLDIALPFGFSYKLNGGLQLKYETLGQYEESLTTRRKGAENKSYSDNYLRVEYTLENILNWNKTINKDHNFFITAMQSIQESQRDGTSITAYNYYDDNIQYYNPSPEYAAGAITGDGNFQKWRIASFMGRLNYNLKEKYLLTATIRSDGSSRLGKGNKWHSFPSVALGWNIMRENFMAKQDIFSALKFRASWGNVGSTAIDPYQTMLVLKANKYMLGSSGVIGVKPFSVPDSSLGWENTETINIGVDFGFLSNRINGTLEVYQQNTKDLLLGVTLPVTSGYTEKYLTNIGATRNRGIEFNVSTINLDGDGKNKLSWNTDFNIFANRNKIKDLGDGVLKDESNNLYLGQDRWTILSLEADGLWQDTPEDRALAEQFGYATSGPGSVIGTVKIKNHHIDYEADGVTPKARQSINDDDRVFIGRRAPNFEGGITNRFGYKGFDLSFLFSFRSGGTLTSSMHNGWMNKLEGKYNNLNVDYWTPDNTSARWPKPSEGGVNYLTLLSRYDASYIKLRNISLGYTLPKSLLKQCGIESARVYATAYNIYTWFDSQYKKDGGIDPETTSTVDVTTPPTRTFIFGINLSF